MMNRRIWLTLGTVLLSLPASSPAQSPPNARAGQNTSHRQLPGEIPDLGSIESMLSERLDQAVQKGKVSDLRELFKDRDRLKELMGGQLNEAQLKVLDSIGPDKLDEILRNPQFKALLEQALANKRGGKGGPLEKDQIASLKSLIKAGGDPSKIPGGEPAFQNAPANKPGPTDESSSQAGPVTPPPSPQSGSAGMTPSGEEGETWIERMMNGITGSVMDELSNPENSGAFQKALRSLGGLKQGSDGSEHFDLAGVWKSATEDAASWMANRWEWPRRAGEPPAGVLQNVRESVPDVAESMNGMLSRLPTGSVGRGGFEEGITRVAWVLFAATMAVIGWNLMTRRRGAGDRSGDGEVLGPWPVAPSAVASRDDLVRAFEYLALLRLGRVGRTSNHLAVASLLNEAESDHSRRAAAGELARLYERARYQPQPAPLADADLAAARRDLALLAGVGSA
jgi:hypothetical protein